MKAEFVVLVDNNNTPIGTMEKFSAHHADTPLHRGFSAYVFDQHGQFLLTQRAKSKKVWPGIWTNSCCGHPAPGESVEDAVKRRLLYELGLVPETMEIVLPDFRYRVVLDGMVENEICPVYLVRVATQPTPNKLEVEAYKWIDWEAYVADVLDNKDAYSEWSYLQVKQMHTLPLVRRFIDSGHARMTKV